MRGEIEKNRKKEEKRRGKKGRGEGGSSRDHGLLVSRFFFFLHVYLVRLQLCVRVHERVLVRGVCVPE